MGRERRLLLSKVAKANAPGLEMILDELGLPVEGLGERLQAAVTTRGPAGARRVDKAKTTKEAIQRMQDEVLALVEPSAEGTDYASRLADLTEKYGKDSDEVKAYTATYKKLQEFFYNDLHSYSTLIGAATLSRKDTLTALDLMNQKADDALANLPEVALSGRSEVNRKRVSDAQAIIAKYTSRGKAPTSKMLNNLQDAQNLLAESRFAEAEAVMRVAQAGTKDKSKIYAAGMKLIRRGVRLAVNTGDAQLLAQVIEGGGKVALGIAKEAVRTLALAWAAYDRMVIDVTNATNAVAAEYSAGAVAPKGGRRALRQFRQAIRNTPAVGPRTGLPRWRLRRCRVAKDDANTLRQDRAALIQARLGVRAATPMPGRRGGCGQDPGPDRCCHDGGGQGGSGGGEDRASGSRRRPGSPTPRPS